MTIEELLYVIADKFQETHRYGIGRTRLLKLAYLADVFYKRLTKERLTDASWVFWHYGPYVAEYPKILASPAFIVEDKGEFENILPAVGRDMPKLTNEEEISILRALRLADEDFNELLDFVYFDTEPMMNADQRGETLDFDCVKPEEEYKVTRYAISKDAQKRIKARLQVLKSQGKIEH
jgi:hypothetical protein